VIARKPLINLIDDWGQLTLISTLKEIDKETDTQEYKKLVENKTHIWREIELEIERMNNPEDKNAKPNVGKNSRLASTSDVSPSNTDNGSSTRVADAENKQTRKTNERTYWWMKWKKSRTTMGTGNQKI
tara:strand:- start:11272 stop:11658 length:387 start_codon:yes stop_codon:yes gene_type:complete